MKSARIAMRKKSNFILILGIGLSFFTTTACAIEISFKSFGSCPADWIFISGDIKAGDSQKLTEVLNKVMAQRKGRCDNPAPTVMLDSGGGDVNEALKIGRLLRTQATPLHTGVQSGAKCYSACVFVLAAGNLRLPAGEVGIHRPYFGALNPNLSSEQVRSIRERNSASLRAYFEEMDVSPLIVDAMLSIAPNEIKVLSEAELKSFRLSVQDANQEETANAKAAATHGLSSSEYRKRYAESVQKCGRIDIDCHYSVILRISVNEWQRRREQFQAECKNIPTDSAKTECAKKFLRANP